MSMPYWMEPSGEDERRAWEPFATPAEAQAELEANWDGDRCSHGFPIGMMIGYDNWCGPCESEAYADEMEYEATEAAHAAEAVAALPTCRHDRTEVIEEYGSRLLSCVDCGDALAGRYDDVPF